MVTDMGSWEFTSSHLCTALYSHLSSCWQEKLFFWGTSPLCLLSVCIPFVQQSHQFGPCWPWLTPLGHCRTCVNLWWICDKQPRQQYHELRLACVWGVELSSEDLEQLCWNTSGFAVFKITDAQVLMNPTWGHPVLLSGPRKGLNHPWEMNYQEKIFWEQKNNCLNITSQCLSTFNLYLCQAGGV